MSKNNNISPGSVKTEIIEHISDDDIQKANKEGAIWSYAIP